MRSLLSPKPPTSPKPRGAFLDTTQINNVARTMYNRYQYDYSLTPSWGDNYKVDENCRLQVKRVLDALEMEGYVVVKMDNKK